MHGSLKSRFPAAPISARLARPTSPTPTLKRPSWQYEELKFDPTSCACATVLPSPSAQQASLPTPKNICARSQPRQLIEIQTLIAEANRGLIALRRGEFEKGEQLYRKAIDGFRLANIPQLRISATAYLAREAALANHPKAASLIADAKISIVKATHHSAPRIIVQAEEHLKAQASRDVAGGRS